MLVVILVALLLVLTLVVILVWRCCKRERTLRGSEKDIEMVCITKVENVFTLTANPNSVGLTYDGRNTHLHTALVAVKRAFRYHHRLHHHHQHVHIHTRILCDIVRYDAAVRGCDGGSGS